VKPAWEHADDRIRDRVDANPSSDHAGIPAEPLHPEVVADHDGCRHAGLVDLVLRERAAHGGRDTEHGKVPIGHHLATQPVRFSVTRHVDVAAGKEGNLVEDFLRALELAVFRVRPDGFPVNAGVVAIRHGHVDEHQALGVGKRQWLEQDGVDGGEDRRIGADAEREGDDGDGCERRRAAEQPQRVADVLDEVTHGTVSLRRGLMALVIAGAGQREPMARRVDEHAPHFAMQPPARRRGSEGVAHPRELLEGVADDPFAFARRRHESDDEERQAGHDSVFSLRSIPAAMPASAL
jgi:hypothetical protein